MKYLTLMLTLATLGYGQMVEDDSTLSYCGFETKYEYLSDGCESIIPSDLDYTGNCIEVPCGCVPKSLPGPNDDRNCDWKHYTFEIFFKVTENSTKARLVSLKLFKHYYGVPDDLLGPIFDLDYLGNDSTQMTIYPTNGGTLNITLPTAEFRWHYLAVTTTVCTLTVERTDTTYWFLEPMRVYVDGELCFTGTELIKGPTGFDLYYEDTTTYSTWHMNGGNLVFRYYYGEGCDPFFGQEYQAYYDEARISICLRSAEEIHDIWGYYDGIVNCEPPQTLRPSSISQRNVRTYTIAGRVLKEVVGTQVVHHGGLPTLKVR